MTSRHKKLWHKYNRVFMLLLWASSIWTRFLAQRKTNQQFSCCLLHCHISRLTIALFLLLTILYKLRVLQIHTCKPSGPISVAARSKAWVCGRSLNGIVGSNSAEGMDVSLLWVLCVVR
jgi:hypothetical protein